MTDATSSMLLFMLPTFLIIRQKEDIFSPGRKQLNMRGERRQLANMPQLRRRLPLHLSTTPVSLTDISQAVLGTRPTKAKSLSLGEYVFLTEFTFMFTH